MYSVRYKLSCPKHTLPTFNFPPSSDPVISDERAQEIIDQALKTSSLNQRNVVAVLTGLMGSGKTWLLSRLFDILPPDLYTSTGLAEKSFRGLLHHIGSISPELWKLLSDRDILRCLAPLFLAGMTEADMASLTANLVAMVHPTIRPPLPSLCRLPSPRQPHPTQLRSLLLQFRWNLSHCRRRAPLARLWLVWSRRHRVL